MHFVWSNMEIQLYNVVLLLRRHIFLISNIFEYLNSQKMEVKKHIWKTDNLKDTDNINMIY